MMHQLTTRDLFKVPINTAEPDDLSYWQGVKHREMGTSPFLRDKPLLAHAMKKIKQLKYGVI